MDDFGGGMDMKATGDKKLKTAKKSDKKIDAKKKHSKETNMKTDKN